MPAPAGSAAGEAESGGDGGLIQAPPDDDDGRLAGLASGGLATAIYALHCTEDNPLFFVTWYGLAILLMAGVGALCGRWVLRW